MANQYSIQLKRSTSNKGSSIYDAHTKIRFLTTPPVQRLTQSHGQAVNMKYTSFP